MTEEKISLGKLYVVIGGHPATLWQMRQEELPPAALPEKEKTREILDFCTEMICDKEEEEEDEGDVAITPQNFPLLRIIKLTVTLVALLVPWRL